MLKLLLTALIVLAIGTADARDRQSQRTLNGCDAGRWAEWARIIDELNGWPIEQADAKRVRDANRSICNDWLTGLLPEADANAAYQETLDAWVRRMEERQRARESNGRAIDSVGYRPSGIKI